MNEDEKKYAELNDKFHKELSEIEAELERLDARHKVLSILLFGSTEEKQELISKDSVSEVREQEAAMKEGTRAWQVSRVRTLKEQGYSNVAIGQELGLAESTVRNMLKPPTKKVKVKQKGTENVVTVDERDQVDHAVLEFLIENPESSARQIIDGLSQFAPDVPYKVSTSLKRLKNSKLIVRSGNTRNSVWSAAEEV